jgi:hypothetical protein
MRDRVQGTRYAHWSSFFLNLLIFIFSRYPHLPLVLSVPGPNQLDGCVKPVQHTTTTTTTTTMSVTHTGPILSARARYLHFGGNTPPPTRSLHPWPQSHQWLYIAHPTYNYHPHHEHHTRRTNIEHMRSVSAFWGQHPHFSLVLSVPSPNQLDGCVKPPQHTTTTTTMSVIHVGPISSAHARYPRFGGNTPTPTCSLQPGLTHPNHYTHSTL